MFFFEKGQVETLSVGASFLSLTELAQSIASHECHARLHEVF